MRNKDFLEQYVKGDIVQGAHGRMAYKDGKLNSYATQICEIHRASKAAYVNTKKYSATTSRMQNALIAILEREGYSIETYDGPEAYIWDAWDMQSKKVTVDGVVNVRRGYR